MLVLRAITLISFVSKQRVERAFLRRAPAQTDRAQNTRTRTAQMAPRVTRRPRNQSGREEGEEGVTGGGVGSGNGKNYFLVMNAFWFW